MKMVSFVLALAFSVAALANGPDGQFPLHPDATQTPGALCNKGNTRRYPEGVLYCERDVDRDLKRDLFRQYDVKFGYDTQSMPRGDFKIDHFIPLCAGGANTADNLWPQHKSVYQQTDPVEPLICAKMASGSLKQVDAIALIKKAKMDFSQIPSVMAYLNGLK